MKSLEIIRLKIEELVLRDISKSIHTDTLAYDIPSNHMLSSIYEKIHRDVVYSLISIYIKNKSVDFDDRVCYKFIENNRESEFFDFSGFLNIEDIPSLCEEIHIDYLNSEFFIHNKVLKKKRSKKNLLAIGAVYTPDEIAHAITLRTLKNLKVKSPEKIKVLDFATGTGRFYRQIVKCFKEIWDVSQDHSITKNIYAIDIDPIAINICRINAFALLEEKNMANMAKISEHIVCGNALIKRDLFVFSSFDSSHLSTLPNPLFYGFDAIVSNPPYLVLKPNRSKMDEETVATIVKMANYFRSSGDYQYSIEGMLNLYQISLEAMLGMLRDGGELGIICPSTLFADISSTKLRKYLLSKHCVSHIRYFSEDEQLFYNVTQATCIFHLKKNGNTGHITIKQGDKSYKIHINDVKALMPTNWEIPCIGKVEWEILKKLMVIPKLQQCPHIRNKRGELDLSLYKGFITTESTPYRLVRGNMISCDGIKDINHEYVIPSFLENKTADFIKNDFGIKRLICQQISNQSQKARLRFVLCEKTDILGNSCNYISVKEENIIPMMTILNSALLNWRFKITSTNNHINNYELDELPIIDLSVLEESIIQLSDVQKDKKICQLYGLNARETNFILSNFYETV